MAVSGIDSSAASAISAASATTNPMDKLTQDYTTFLKMLTTQLQNQDPLSPMDTNQFTQQLVSFSGVEQQIKQNTKLDSLIGLQQSANGLTSMLGYIGKSAEVDSGSVYLDKNGASFGYTLTDSAKSATATITDSSGATVRTVDLSGTVGKHLMQWDGTDANGTALPNGTYNIAVQATKNDGSAMTGITTTFVGQITGLENTTSGIQLYMGSLKIDQSKIKSIGA